MLLAGAFEEVDHILLHYRDHLFKRLIILIHVLNLVQCIFVAVPIVGDYRADPVNQLVEVKVLVDECLLMHVSDCGQVHCKGHELFIDFTLLECVYLQVPELSFKEVTERSLLQIM